MKDKNRSIEALRFIFMLMICLWHCMDAREFIKHGYIGVEFYFILSGVFLYMSTTKKEIISPLEYSIKRFKRFNPKYAVSVLITYMYLYLPDIVKGNGSFWTEHRYMGVVPDIMMLQSIGVFNGLGGANKPLWYMSVLLIGGSMVYSMIYSNKKLAINLFFPLLCCLGYTYLFHCSAENTIESWVINGCICNPLVRGICDMSLGAMVGHVICLKKDYLDKYSVPVNICSVASLFVIFFLSVYKYPFDNISLIAFSLLIVGCLSEHSIINRVFKNRIWSHLGALSYSMLLLHYPVMLITRRLLSVIEINNGLLIAIYLINVIACSLLFDWLFEKRFKVLSVITKT